MYIGKQRKRSLLKYFDMRAMKVDKKKKKKADNIKAEINEKKKVRYKNLSLNSRATLLTLYHFCSQVINFVWSRLVYFL